MSEPQIRLVIPTGRMHDDVVRLLADAGVRVSTGGGNYRPRCSDPRYRIKLMKAANVPTLVELGAHDAGFTGLDWIRETRADVVEVVDTGLLPVRVVAAAPRGCDPFAPGGRRPVVVASEYERLTREAMERRGVPWRYVRTWGATEVFPPEDADMIVDNTATGSALAANDLEVVDELLTSTTRFVAGPAALDDAAKREALEDLAMLMRGALAGRERVLVEMNVGAEDLDAVVRLLPAMKAPTVQPLYGNGQFAVKAAVPRAGVARLVPELRRAGASDILETVIRRITP